MFYTFVHRKGKKMINYYTMCNENEKATKLLKNCNEICKVLCNAVTRSTEVDSNIVYNPIDGIISIHAVELQESITLKWFYSLSKTAPKQTNLAISFALVNFYNVFYDMNLVPIGLESISKDCAELSVAPVGTIATPRALLQALCFNA